MRRETPNWVIHAGAPGYPGQPDRPRSARRGAGVYQLPPLGDDSFTSPSGEAPLQPFAFGRSRAAVITTSGISEAVSDK